MTGINSPPTEEIKERLVALTRDLILIPGTASRPEDIDRGMELVRNHLESLEDISITEYSPEGNPSLVVLPNGINKPCVLLCGHIDVIMHPNIRSYRSHITDGRIYGPGAGDMKGPLAILLEVFREMHTRYPCSSLGLVVTSDEERGGETGMRYLLEEVGLRSNVAMIPDGGSLTQVTVEEKGVLHLKIHAKGHSAHSARPWLGNNPLEMIVHKLGDVLKHFKTFQKEETRWYPTCALTIVNTFNKTVNRIPGDASAIIDVRFTPPHTAESILHEIQSKLGEEITTEIIISADPSHLSPDPVYLKVIEDVIGEVPTLIKTDGGSDARFICCHGIPVMVSRPLMGNLHAEDEWIDIESMVKFYRIYEQYLEKKLEVT